MMAATMTHDMGSGPGPRRFLWALIRRLARESPALVILGSVTALLQSAVLVPIAVLVRHLFNSEIPGRHTGAIVVIGAAIVVLYGAAAAFGYVARVTALGIASRVVTTLRQDLVAKLLALPQQWHDRQRMAAMQSTAAQDTERVEAMLATFAGSVMPAVLVGSVLIAAGLVISPLLFLTGFAVVPPLVFASRVMARRVRVATQEWSGASRRFSAYSQLLLRAIVTTRIVGGERSVWQGAAERAAEVSERHRRLGQAGATLSAIESGIAAVAGTAVLVVGGIEVADHVLSLGDMLAFYAVLGLLLRQVYSIGWQTNAVAIGFQALRDITDLLSIDQAEPYASGHRKIEFRGGVNLENVSFSYADAPVLHDLTLTVHPGEHLAVIGPNGAGKSTLANLVLALYEPDAGVLRADDVRYDELDIRSLRRQIGVVLQDPVLLPGTIRTNIAYARPEVSDEAVRAAARAATASEFIERLPDGYETVIGDEGIGLSGGQRQRIAIARALLGGPALLLLDEPSTYLDDAAVAALMSCIMALPQAPTVLLVTHDSELASHVDRVIELRAGRVVRDFRARPQVDAARI